jgi:microsomal epoxide hydrolase
MTASHRRRGLLQALGAGALLGPAAWPARAADDARHSLVTSDGVRLSLLEQRPDPAAPGPGVLLLPGWCMPASIWRGQLAALGARWPTLAVDPRGQGQSEVPAGGYTADRRADDLHDVLQGRERVVLVGWSLGVLEALQYVHRHGSARLAGLVLVDNSIGEPPAPKGGNRFAEELRQERRPALERFVRGMFAVPPPAPLLDELLDSALRMPLEASLALLSYPYPREHWRAIVEAFDRPLAYLVTPRYREQAQNLRRARPQARIEIFEHAGHALFVDEAARFNRVLGEWIEGLG